MKDLLRIADLSSADMSVILDLADEFRTDPYRHDRLLNDESVFAYFTKPSTRTRVSLAEAVARLGGQLQFIGPHELDLDQGETIEDTAAVVSRYAKILIVRTFAHDDVVRLAGAATVPVINARTDLHHPCQALADVMTIRHRRGRLRGARIAYLGAGNNVAHSLMEAAALVGAHLVVATPPRFAPDPRVTAEAQRMAATSGGSVTLTEHPFEAVAGADVVYTGAWAHMGDTEDGGSSRRRILLEPFQVNDMLMSKASSDCIFMHCLPAYRGQEVTSDVLDGPQSVVLDQAENRLHTEQALMVALLSSMLEGGRR